MCPWKRNILHIEQVMKYAPVLNENQITYRMMLKLVFHFVVLYRLVTKYLFREDLILENLPTALLLDQ